MRARLVNEEQIGKPQMFNKKQIIDFMLAGEEPEVQEMMRPEYESASKEEFEELANAIGFQPIGKFWTASDVVDSRENYGRHGEYSPEYWDGFDLDQEIYDRNPDHDVDESLNEKSSIEGDYAEAQWKMDKFMPDDFDLQSEFYEILDDETKSKEEKIEELIEFFGNYADEETAMHYFPKNGTLEGFVEYIVNNEG